MKNDKDLSQGLFYGNYNGNGFKIKNLYVNKTSKNRYAGLFGSLAGSDAIIENLAVYGEVNCENGCVGGIAGEIVHNNSIIRNCNFIGDVKGKYEVAGIVGVIYNNGVVENSYHLGNIFAQENAGGIVGLLNVGQGRYSIANVKNCYNVGEVKCESGLFGAIVGNINYGKDGGETYVKNCYYLKDDCAVGYNGEATEVDITALSSSLMKKIADDLGEPFVNNTSSEINDGYPVFSWQLKSVEDTSYEIGDVNNDGVQDITDLSIICLHIIGDIKLNEYESEAADVDGNGEITLADLARLKQFVSKKIPSLK